MRPVGAALTAVAVLLAIAASAQALSPEQALDRLNMLRARSGLPAVTTLEPAWNVGCQHHNHYMALHGLGHLESLGLPRYTADGFDAGLRSVLARAPSGELAMSAWLAGVFHRRAIFDPRLRAVGFDASEGFACLWAQGEGTQDDGATTPGLTLYPSPGDGEHEVPTRFTVDEQPSPYDETGVNVDQLGWLISVMVNGPWTDGSAFSSDVTATLVPEDPPGEPVPIAISQAGTALGSFMGDGFGIFPLRPLAPHTRYRVRASGKVTALVGGQVLPFTNFSWAFSTGADSAPPSTPADPWPGFDDGHLPTPAVPLAPDVATGGFVGILQAGRSVTVARRSVRIVLSCDGRANARCSAVVKLIAAGRRGRGRAIGVGSRRLVLGGGSRVRLRVRLNSAGTSLLKRLGRLPIRVVTTQRLASTTRPIAVSRLTIRPRKR